MTPFLQKWNLLDEKELHTFLKSNYKSSTPPSSLRNRRPDLWSPISMSPGDSDQEKLFNYINRNPVTPKCYCGKNTSFVNFSKGYRKYCCIACSTASQDRKNLENISKCKLDKRKIREKTAKTNMQKYGHVCNLHAPAQVNTIRHKIKSKMDLITQKIKNTNLQRYGVEWITQTDNLINAANKKHSELWVETHFKPYVEKLNSLGIDVLSNPDSIPTTLEVVHRDCNHNFTIIYRGSTRCPNCQKSGSLVENEIADFIETLIPIERNNRKIISPLELDIFIPTKNIAIEVNGVYWHRDQDGKRTLLDKTNLCESRGVQLIHIWDYEWINEQEKVKKFLIQKFSPSKKFFARKLSVREVDFVSAKNFCQDNHRQGWANAKFRIGLFDGDELISLLTASKPRFRKCEDLEIVRYCSTALVVGGFKKLLHHLVKITEVKTIMTYVDRRFGDGGVYKSAGFKHISNTPPGYFYTSSKLHILNRYACQLHLLPKLLQDKFDSSLNERQNMERSGYWRCSDAGNLVLVFEINDK